MESKSTYNRRITWMMAKTAFQLRFEGSALGYLWSMLEPLFIFTIMYFVFSSVFARGAGNEFYALELLTSLLLFNYFANGSTAGMGALVDKESLIKKIPLPMWTMIIAANIQQLLIFLTSIAVIVIFFIWQGFVPSLLGLGQFLLAIIQFTVLMLAFSLASAPLFVRFRDIKMLWNIATRALLYTSPIIYPLSLMPDHIQQLLLINPTAFIIHFMKAGLIHNHFPELWQALLFNGILVLLLILSILVYRKLAPKVPELL